MTKIKYNVGDIVKRKSNGKKVSDLYDKGRSY